MRTTRTALVAAAAALALTACSDPSSSGGGSDDDSTVRIGSAAFPESEIIAEVYAQALEAEDFSVERRMQIGAREVYLPALENGELDMLPEYTGNLLSYIDSETTATSPEDIEAELPDALPDGLEILDPAPAENKDSLNVTEDFASENDVASIADLADVDGLSLAANPEFAERSYGIPGMERVYGITGVDFTPINDGGGPATLSALLDGTVDVADIYSTTPSIVENNLVTLEDPENMIAAQNVVPVISSDTVSDEAIEVLNKVSAELTTEDLIEMNTRNSGDEKAAPATIAKDWLEDKGLI
ncbi:ABC transporter substrate-binding protein [Aeromicrobium sp. YIM 150415]|uniref:ABC transporter substrate-binding protein n=1 Tax=Aeromicrobium sp. YIM 150415 TaxID=2803912 RepID=UPI0019629D49|nr:ABC transporter substrate-binding protein [Aeromicrobium sp. YIM 150415]MBM9464738.1 ABC transporter substrate-binding protein [Aeromicrobium sp. YIM 150415]